MGTNVLAVSAGSDSAGEATFLAEPPDHSHAVQFYDDEQFLLATVAQFLIAGLRAGDRLVVCVTPEHSAAIAALLVPYGGRAALDSGQLVVLDAREMLSMFMVRDMPDSALFRLAILPVITRPIGGRVRAYGEMVELLWRDGNARGALRLEALWNELAREQSFALLCAYAMRNFDTGGDADSFLALCQSHSHVMPTESFTQLGDPAARLREIGSLQQRARALENELHHREALEDQLRSALRDRDRVAAELRASLGREQEARARAEASDAFKEIFLGVVGHELRAPLSTIMTTLDLMIMRGELPEEVLRRLRKVATSGTRMKRMIDQLLDLTRARLDGFPVELREQAIGPLLSKIIDELQTAHPTRMINLHADPTCRARVDADRFEQVVANLVGNAIAHGDPALSITVTVGYRAELLELRVHNYGAAILPALQATLFDPFSRGKRTGGAAAGLGLGLYISQRIAEAHGGTLTVRSSPETGTELEMLIPV